MLFSLCPRCTQKCCLSRDVALFAADSAPKSVFCWGGAALSARKSVVFSGMLPSQHPKVLRFQGFCSLCTRCVFDNVFLFGSMPSTTLIGQTPFMGRSCGPIWGIFFYVRKRSHIPPTPFSRPMSQRSQRHRKTTRKHIKKLSLQTRGRSTITRQQPITLHELIPGRIF